MYCRALQVGGGLITTGALFVVAVVAERGRPEPRPISNVAIGSNIRAGKPIQGTPLFSDTGEPMGTFYPMAREMKRQGGVAGATDPDAACRADPGAVYCNSLSPGWWQPPGNNPHIQIGDDAALAALAGCELDRYVLKVNGNTDGSAEGPYSVDAALYTACPGVLGVTPIPGTECHKDLPDDGAHIVVCDAAEGTILPSSNVWVGLRFSRLHCAVAVGAPATKGFSADLLDFPGFACTANLGGFKPQTKYDYYGKHASFFLEVYTHGACADPESDLPTEAFPNYKSSNHNGWSYTPGGGIRFADDVSLEVPQCWMTRMEVAVRGDGVTTIDLRTGLNDADPSNGGVIPGTRFFVAGGSDVVIASKDFEPPILLTQPDLWVGYHTTSAVTGPIITDRPASLGRNEDLIWIHNGARWQTRPLDGGRYAATDVTIHCADWPPLGACCDMIFTDNHTCVGGDNDGQPCTSWTDCTGGTCIGDSVCRDGLAAMNCPTSDVPSLWVRGGECAGVCVGGDNNGAPCTRQVDCPGFSCVGGTHPGDPCETDEDCQGVGWCQRAECDGPFIRSCGTAACCTPDCECYDLTEKECYQSSPIDDPPDYQMGQFCGLSGQRCPARGYGACEHPDPECCRRVCSVDLFCCLVEWDRFCVELAIELCPEPPANDECSGEIGYGARRILVPGNLLADVQNGTESESDPGFCCHTDDPDAQGIGTVWFKFVAPEPANTQDEFSSVGVNTCWTNSSHGRDSLLQVFEPADPDRGICSDGTLCGLSAQDCADGSDCVFDEETACHTLIPIACNDDAVPACPRLGLSRVCLPRLVPGQAYYVMVAAKNEDNRDTYRLDITQGCTTGLPIPNDMCADAALLKSNGTLPLIVPFDLSGGEEYTPATYDCYNPQDILGNLRNDIWYDWVAPTDGRATIETCDHSILNPHEQPNTGLIVYDGCACPIDDAHVIAFSDICGGDCGPSSCVTFEIAEGGCYKIRLGGHRGGQPAGNLRLSFTFWECAVGPVTFLDPPDGTVDARRPHPPHDAGVLEGIDSILVAAPPGADIMHCWTLCETEIITTANLIKDITDSGDGTFTIQLDRPITPGAATTITYMSMDGVASTGIFIAHPANVNADPVADPADVNMLIDILSGAVPPPYGSYSADCDHSGSITPADLLCVLDLLNGADAYALEWNGTPLPWLGDCLPSDK